jgi:hypothetical protein
VENDHGSSKLAKPVRWFNQRRKFSSRRLAEWSHKIRACLAPGLLMKSAHVSTLKDSLMEFIIVRIAGEPAAQVDVLINGQKHGTTGSLVTLGTPGTVFVSVDRPTAQQREMVVQNTTAAHPMDVDIVAPLAG